MTAPGTPGRLEEALDRTGTSLRVVIVLVALLAATAATAVLEQSVGVVDASPVYLIPVVVAASLLGTWAAIATSAVAFLAYDYLFTVPRFTLLVSDPAEWLSLLLFVVVAVVIGRLTALLRERVEIADRRSREGMALVAISRDIAMATDFEGAAEAVTSRLLADAEMRGVWVSLADDADAVVARAGDVGDPRGATPWTLVQSGVDGSSDWLRVHSTAGSRAGPSDGAHYVVPIEGNGAPLGWIHAVRAPGDPTPGRGARRILVLAADQLGIALRRDELRAELTAAEVDRQSDALRGAILDSVSHDLRTPIASVRALAGGLLDAAVEPDPEVVRATAAAIDQEATRLGELVGSLLDMGRIQAGALRPDLEPHDLGTLVETALRHRPIAGRQVSVESPDDLGPVLVDAVLFDVALGNVLDNAVGHTAADAAIRIRAAAEGRDHVVLTVDDAGPGVPEDALPRLFDRFYRVPGSLEPARHGLGMGLAIARGFVEAMGGTIEAGTSDLGGLSVRFRLRRAPGETEP